jgi:hypothetical protein
LGQQGEQKQALHQQEQHSNQLQDIQAVQSSGYQGADYQA